MTTGRIVLVLLLAAAGAACAAFGEFASDDPGFAERPGTFEGRFIALADADMAATAYADGKLEPLEGAADEARLFVNGAASGSAPASNSVVSWPQVIDVSPDGRFAYVAETRGAPPPRVAKVDNPFEDFPPGSRLTVLGVGDDALTGVAQIRGAGVNLQSVEAAANGRFLALGSEEDGAELVIIPLTDGLPAGEPLKFALAPPFKDEDGERRVRTLHLSPDSAMIAVNIANLRVQFYRLTLDESGLPSAVTALGAPVEGLGRRLAVGKWTPDGRYFLITDTNSFDAGPAMLFQGPSAISVVAPPAADTPARFVSRATVGRFAEGFSISPDGRRVAAVNMERTYLPEIAPLAFWKGRRLYSVSLLSLDPATGAVAETSRVSAAGVLPEDVIFDKTGDNLAVAVFHRRKGADRKRGFIDFYAVENGKLVAQGATQAMMRGPHDLVALP